MLLCNNHSVTIIIYLIIRYFVQDLLVRQILQDHAKKMTFFQSELHRPINVKTILL